MLGSTAGMLRSGLRRLTSAARASHHSGNLYLGGAIISGVGAAALWIAQERDAQLRASLNADFDDALATARAKAREDTEATASKVKQLPTLWTGTLTMADPRLKGHLMLQGARIGQTVDVVEEGVGSDGRYLTVVDRSTGEIGMHLVDWIEKTQ